jgi:hypothetical protein
MTSPPEHEYLVIEIMDKKETKRLFILERTVGAPDLLDNVAGAPVHGLLHKIRLFMDSAITTLKSDSSTSMEEGSSVLGTLDKMTLISVQSADLISECTNNENMHSPALDRILGEGYVFSKPWFGQNLRHFKPGKPFSLFKLLVLANSVHQLHLDYILFHGQCYFYAALLYSDIQYNYGSRLSNENDELLEKFGRWNDFKVCNIDHDKDVVPLVKAFKEVYNREIVEVEKVSSFFQIEVS